MVTEKLVESVGRARAEDALEESSRPTATSPSPRARKVKVEYERRKLGMPYYVRVKLEVEGRVVAAASLHYGIMGDGCYIETAEDETTIDATYRHKVDPLGWVKSWIERFKEYEGEVVVETNDSDVYSAFL